MSDSGHLKPPLFSLQKLIIGSQRKEAMLMPVYAVTACSGPLNWYAVRHTSLISFVAFFSDAAARHKKNVWL